MKWILRLCIFILLPFLFTKAYTAPTIFDTNKAQFETDNATALVEQYALQLNNENLNVKKLNRYIDDLETTLKKAFVCVEKTSSKIDDINTQIKQFLADTKAPKGVDVKYLETQKEILNDRLARCRLLTLHVDEILDEYRSALLSLQQEITFTRGETILTRVQQLPSDWDNLSLPEYSDLHLFKVKNSFLIWLIPLFLVSLGISTQLQRWFHKKWHKEKRSIFFNACLLIGALVFLMAFAITNTPFKAKVDNALFNEILWDGFLFFTLVFLYRFLFLFRRVSTLLHWYGFDVVFLHRVGLVIIAIYFFRELGLDLLSLYQAPSTIIQLYETVILIISLAATLYFSLQFYHLHRLWLERYLYGEKLIRIIILSSITLLVLDFIGYSILAVYTSQVLMALLLVSALGFLLLRGINKIYQVICYTYPARKHLKKYFGYTTEPPYLEILLLKIMLQLVVIIGLCSIFAGLIGEVGYFLDYFFEYLITGFSVSGVRVTPFQWLIGVVVFCFLVLCSRHIATKISRSQQFDEEEETQVAFASIALYVGFAISIILGLLMAGFSFTSLAIIAGALSLGIGLGLQSIVNNFFSGLILLIEKPIKAGDRIKIDGVEGFVKKVRVRSTQLLTPAQEDIIIPNSDLITHQVTNYMFSDTYWRVKCSVGVAYGSDTELVRELMLNVALSHPEVVKKKGKEPMVLFSSFGNSALIFEMWCLIKDVNKKYLVASDLNFAIDQAFRKHQVTIAFPQLDVHIDMMPDGLVKKNQE